MSGHQVIPDWKEGTERRVTERRIPNVVAQYAVRENARLAEQVRVLREALYRMHAVFGGEGMIDSPACNQASAALAATSPCVSARKLSDFGGPEHDRDIAGRPLRPGT